MNKTHAPTKPKYNHPLVIHTVYLLCGMLVSWLLGMTASLLYYDYALFPPRVLKEIRQLKKVDTLVYAKVLHPQEEYEFNNVLSVANASPSSAREFYEPATRERIPRLLKHIQVPIEHNRQLNKETLLNVWKMLNDADLLTDGAYGMGKELYGHIGIGATANGERIGFGGLVGMNIKNDHFIYYEFTFEPEMESPILKSVQSFYFDVAGLEGVIHWFSIFILTLFFTVPASQLAALIHVRRMKLRLSLALNQTM